MRDGAAQKEGEICLTLEPRPTGLMQGYQDDGGSVAPIGKADYRTGDVAMVDADGYLTYVGRADDVFKSSDYRISPFELESVLIEHPAVAEAAVVPSPDPIRLAVPKAFIVLGAGPRAGSRNGAVDLPALPRRAGAVQARAAARIRRPAEDHLRQNPPRRAAARRGGEPAETANARRSNSGKTTSPTTNWARRRERVRIRDGARQTCCARRRSS